MSKATAFSDRIPPDARAHINKVKADARVTLVRALVTNISEYAKRPLVLNSDWREIVWPPVEQYLSHVLTEEADIKINRMVLADRVAVNAGYHLLRQFAIKRRKQICSVNGLWVVAVRYAAKYAGLPVPPDQTEAEISTDSEQYKKYLILSGPRRQQVTLYLGVLLQSWKSKMWGRCETELLRPLEATDRAATQETLADQSQLPTVEQVKPASSEHPAEGGVKLVIEKRLGKILRREEDFRRFPARAEWLKKILEARRWSPYALQEKGGPDIKTVKKILRSEAVKIEVLEKLYKTLFPLKKEFDIFKDIPWD